MAQTIGRRGKNLWMDRVREWGVEGWLVSSVNSFVAATEVFLFPLLTPYFQVGRFCEAE